MGIQGLKTDSAFLGFGFLVFFGCWMLSDTKLPFQEAKRKWVSMKVAGEEVETAFL
jgi:hypothetical protein